MPASALRSRRARPYAMLLTAVQPGPCLLVFSADSWLFPYGVRTAADCRMRLLVECGRVAGECAKVRRVWRGDCGGGHGGAQ